MGLVGRAIVAAEREFVVVSASLEVSCCVRE